MADDDFQQRLARVIRRRRERLLVSQEAFADRIGVHRTYHSSIERGERNVSLKNLVRISIGLDVPLSKLIAEAERLPAQSIAAPEATRTGLRARKR